MMWSFFETRPILASKNDLIGKRMLVVKLPFPFSITSCMVFTWKHHTNFFRCSNNLRRDKMILHITWYRLRFLNYHAGKNWGIKQNCAAKKYIIQKIWLVLQFLYFFAKPYILIMNVSYCCFCIFHDIFLVWNA